MIFEYGSFCVDIDVELTKAFYDKSAKTVIEDCGCVNCRNYYEAILNTSDKVLSFFKSLGIDPQKSPEAICWDTDKNRSAHYSIIFHLVGTLVNSVEIYRPTGENAITQIIENFFEIDNEFKAGFTSNIDLLEKDFPEPCVQLEIDARLPWVLD